MSATSSRPPSTRTATAFPRAAFAIVDVDVQDAHASAGERRRAVLQPAAGRLPRRLRGRRVGRRRGGKAVGFDRRPRHSAGRTGARRFPLRREARASGPPGAELVLRRLRCPGTLPAAGARSDRRRVGGRVPGRRSVRAGALAAARAKGVVGIGFGADQSSLGPYVLTSVVERADVAVEAAVRIRAVGAADGGTNVIFEAANGGITVGRWSPRVSAAVRRAVAAQFALLKAGKIPGSRRRSSSGSRGRPPVRYGRCGWQRHSGSSSRCSERGAAAHTRRAPPRPRSRSRRRRRRRATCGSGWSDSLDVDVAGVAGVHGTLARVGGLPLVVVSADAAGPAAVANAARAHPLSHFALVGGSTKHHRVGNLVGLVLRDEQAARLAGLVAGYATADAGGTAPRVAWVGPAGPPARRCVRAGRSSGVAGCHRPRRMVAVDPGPVQGGSAGRDRARRDGGRCGPRPLCRRLPSRPPGSRTCRGFSSVTSSFPTSLRT